MKRFCDLNPEDFRNATVFLDIDGTLVPDGEEAPAPSEAHVLSTLTRVAQVYLLASKGFHRVRAIAREYGAEAIVTQFLKPSKRIITGIAVPRWSRYVIGDKVMTDGWFASRINARFVQVARLTNGNESLLVKCLYAADAIVWAIASVWNTLTRSTFWLYIQVARPPQWRKNLLILVPAFLAGHLFEVDALVLLLFGVIAFSASASVSYVVNDIIDCEIDVKNPAKKDRPIACGLIPIPHAILYAVFLAGIAVVAAAEAPAIIPWVMGYLALTHVYTFYLKRFPVAELFAVSGFYLLRVLGGAAIVGVVLSPWLVLVVFFASLFVAAGGRYAESKRPYPHVIVKRYPEDFLKLTPIFFGMLTVFFYALSVFGSGPVVWTISIVVFSVTWYLRSIYRAGSDASREDRLWDSVILWASLALLISILSMSYVG